MHPSRKLRPLALSLALLAGSFAAGSAVAAKPSKIMDTASSITYALPETQVKVGIDLVITNCSPVKVRGTLTLAASAVPSPAHRFTISGADLASFRLKRDLSLELHPNDALKSVNGAVSDRSAAIILNVVKMLATAGSMSVLIVRDPDEPDKPDSHFRCNEDALKAFGEASSLRAQIDPLRKRLVEGMPGSPGDLADLQEKIDVLAQYLAAIEQEKLTVKLSGAINFGEGKFEDGGYSGALQWNRSQLESHFIAPPGGQGLNLDLAWKLVDPSCGTQCAPRPPASAAICGPCNDTIVFREPVPVSLEVWMSTQANVPKARLQFPMAQWGTLTYFPLRAKFGENKSLKLAMDEFGRRTSFGWSSAARGEEITSAASGILDGAATYRTARESEDTKARKAELEEFDTLMKWNAMKRCQAAIEAGASKCPADPD